MYSEELFPGFRRTTAQISESIEIPYVTAGTGPPLLLLHGFPQTHAMWHKVAGDLARHFAVVAPDLRGYGDASKPVGPEDHSLYSKRAMAGDPLHIMRALGHERFQVLAHDRGARVAHRLALDHPEVVERLMVLDIAPTLSMYEKTDLSFAMTYWHWFFLVQKTPLPETLINADPEFMLRSFMGGRHAGLAVFSPQALNAYLRAARDPAAIHAMCEDYRASAGIDLAHDRADRDAGRRLTIPLRVLWGEFGGLHRCLDPLEHWRGFADDVDGRALPCGHYIAEEAPQALLAEALKFFGISRRLESRRAIM